VLTLGEVITAEPGSSAAASLTGTAAEPVLNLTIPRGDTGSIENLTVNGKGADAAGNIELTAADFTLDAISEETIDGILV